MLLAEASVIRMMRKGLPEEVADDLSLERQLGVIPVRK